MVVDDEAIVCDRVKNHLEKDGFRVDAFTESDRATEALEKERYHVVVTDLKMAGVTGLDILRRVRDCGYPTQVIIITGYASYETAREAEGVGAYDFICKPFELKHLSKLVKKAAKRAKRDIGPSGIGG
jgi:DNA-binding NtrC family response regulator